MNATIDRAGRLVVPKPVREAAHLHPGTQVRFRVLDGRVEIEPVPMAVRFERSGTMVVAVAQKEGAIVTTEEIEQTLAEIRTERWSDQHSE